VAVRSRRVLHDADSLDGDQRTAGDHLVQDRQQFVDMGLIIDDFDQYRQIRREFDEACGVYHTIRAESRHSVDHCRAGKALASQSLKEDPEPAGEDRACQRRRRVQ
jgi:hypothetical protein